MKYKIYYYPMNNQWETLADDATIQKVIDALKENGINAEVVSSSEAAKKRVLELIPEGAEVFNNTSVTLKTISVLDELLNSGKYNSVRKQWEKLDKSKPEDAKQMQQQGAAPDWMLGSVHAVTHDGQVFVASNSGSQLAAYVYGANHVIWVVSTKKIVENEQQAKDRIYQHVLPKESVRAREAYGRPADYQSYVSKLLQINRETRKDRITLLFVKENLGF